AQIALLEVGLGDQRGRRDLRARQRRGRCSGLGGGAQAFLELHLRRLAPFEALAVEQLDAVVGVGVVARRDHDAGVGGEGAGERRLAGAGADAVGPEEPFAGGLGAQPCLPRPRRAGRSGGVSTCGGVSTTRTWTLNGCTIWINGSGEATGNCTSNGKAWPS